MTPPDTLTANLQARLTNLAVIPSETERPGRHAAGPGWPQAMAQPRGSVPLDASCGGRTMTRWREGRHLLRPSTCRQCLLEGTRVTYFHVRKRWPGSCA